MKKQNKFIVFEGVDHSGKTTLARALAKRLNGLYIYTSSFFDDVRHRATQGKSNQTKFFFYMMTNNYFNDEIDRHLNNTPVVCDRWWYSSYAHHPAISFDPRLFQNLKKPDLVVYTYASYKIIENRKYQSSKISLGNEDLAYLKKTDKIFRKIIPKKTLYIDTGKISIEDCIQMIINAL